MEYVAGYLASSWLLCGCFLDAFCTLSGCLLCAVVLVIPLMLVAVGYVVEYVLEHVLEHVVGYLASCWLLSGCFMVVFWLVSGCCLVVCSFDLKIALCCVILSGICG